MADSRLPILCLTGFPPSPPTFGAQRRIHGLLTGLARRHDVTVLSLSGPEFDLAVAEREMRAYCRPVFVPAGPSEGLGKRLLQLRSLVSTHTFEDFHFLVPALRRKLAELLSARRYDIVQIEAHLFASLALRRAPPGAPLPRVVLDAHNVEYDLARQMSAGPLHPARRLYNAVNWRKLRREEHRAWRTCDGVVFTSELDRARARSDVPSVRAVVAPNAVDVGYFRPGPEDAADGRTVLFFGTVDYFPNRDGLGWFLREVWPQVAARHPDARLQIVGPRPTPEVLAARGPKVEVTGLVQDLRPYVARAAMTVVPLRIGGGTRLKIVEALAMAKPIVSTSLGAEGIQVTDEQDILLADDAASFAGAVGRILDDSALRARLGTAARALAERLYSWSSAADTLEAFYFELLGRRSATGSTPTREAIRRARSAR